MKTLNKLIFASLIFMTSCKSSQLGSNSTSQKISEEKSVCFKLNKSLLPDSLILTYYTYSKIQSNHTTWKYSLDSLMVINSSFELSTIMPENVIDQTYFTLKSNSDSLKVDYYKGDQLLTDLTSNLIPEAISFCHYKGKDLKILRYEKRDLAEVVREIIYFNDSLGILEIIYPNGNNGYSLMNSCHPYPDLHIHDVLLSIQKDSTFYITRPREVIDVHLPPKED